jgi:putative membrane protein
VTSKLDVHDSPPVNRTFDDWKLTMLTSLAVAAGAAGVGAHWVGAGFGWLFLLIPLFWIGVFVLIFALVGRRWRRGGYGPYGHGPGYGHGWGHEGSTQSAEKTLAERFAQGDIDETEYRARLEVLRANRPTNPEA